MKPTILVLAVAMPLVAAIVALRVSNEDESTARRSVVESASGNERLSSVEDPVLVPPEIRFPPESLGSEDFEVTDEDMNRLRKRLLGALAEEFEQSIDEEIQRSWSLSAHLGIEPQTEATRRYDQDPTWPRISALPGVAGFEIKVCPRSECISDWLAEEPDDAAWARPMEARIIGAVGSRAKGGLAQIFVVCRQETCGIVLPPSPGATVSALLTSGIALRDTLGFAYYSIAQRTDFQAIYLTNRDQAPERSVQ